MVIQNQMLLFLRYRDLIGVTDKNEYSLKKMKKSQVYLKIYIEVI